MSHEERIEYYLQNLFRSSYQVHDLVAQLKRQSRVLTEISMNAAIAAGHTGGQSRVFGEIAKQIGIVANQFLETCGQIHEQTGQMSGQTLECLIQQAMRGKFLQALRELSRPSTQADVAALAETQSEKILVLIARTQTSLTRMHPERERMRMLTHRIWSIVVGLKVSAGMADIKEQPFFFSIADALEGSANQIGELVDSLSGVMTSVDSELRQGTSYVREESDAA